MLPTTIKFMLPTTIKFIPTYVEELPAKLISNSEVRKAIYLAYTNFEDTYIDTILDILREQASDKTLALVEDL